MSSLPDIHRPHAADPDPRLTAVAADLEYFRAKRLEPRVPHLVRRGVISLNDLIRAGRDTVADRTSRAAPADVEQRVRALEDRLDAFVAGIAAVAVATRSADVVIEDIRHERGDYHPFLKIARRTYSGSVKERMSQLEQGLTDSEELLGAFTRALLDTGEITARQLDQRRQALRNQGYRNGARLVARAWVDPGFRRRLQETGRKAARELDIPRASSASWASRRTPATRGSARTGTPWASWSGCGTTRPAGARGRLDTSGGRSGRSSHSTARSPTRWITETATRRCAPCVSSFRN